LIFFVCYSRYGTIILAKSKKREKSDTSFTSQFVSESQIFFLFFSWDRKKKCYDKIVLLERREMEGRYTVEVGKERFSVSEKTSQDITKLQQIINKKKRWIHENIQDIVWKCIISINQEQGLNNRQKTILMNFFSRQILQIINDKTLSPNLPKNQNNRR